MEVESPSLLDQSWLNVMLTIIFEVKNVIFTVEQLPHHRPCIRFQKTNEVISSNHLVTKGDCKKHLSVLRQKKDFE